LVNEVTYIAETTNSIGQVYEHISWDW